MEMLKRVCPPCEKGFWFRCAKQSFLNRSLGTVAEWSREHLAVALALRESVFRNATRMIAFKKNSASFDESICSHC